MKIKINGKKEFTRQYGYSENCTDRKVLKKGTKLIHGSYYEIDAFAPIETCFTTYEWAKEYGLGIKGYTYLAILKKDVEVEYYGEDEVRFEISEENIDIEYIGNYDDFEKVEKYKMVDFLPRYSKVLKYTKYNFKDAELSKALTENEEKKIDETGKFYNKYYKEI